jgi:hypothetical protein
VRLINFRIKTATPFLIRVDFNLIQKSNQFPVIVQNYGLWTHNRRGSVDEVRQHQKWGGGEQTIHSERKFGAV